MIMSNLYFSVDGEPAVLEDHLHVPCIITKDHQRVNTPTIEKNGISALLCVETYFNTTIPPTCRMLIPTGLQFHFQKGYSGVVYSHPHLVNELGLYVVSQTITSGDSVNLVVINYGANDLHIFGGMKIAHFNMVATPPLSRLVVRDASDKFFIRK